MARITRIALAAALAAVLAPAPAHAADRWHETGRTPIPLEYFQGMTSDPDRHLWFDGVFAGLYRTDARLHERARNETEIPPAVTASAGFNHIGDPTWDGREDGRVLLPLECYDPNAPGGSTNTCGRGAIGVADPVTLRWRYYVELDPSEIAKAMWAEVSPDGRLLWTSSGPDLLAYRTAELTRARAAPGGAPLRAVRRLAGAVPTQGITGAAFYGDRLLLAGGTAAGYAIYSVDLRTGSRRLELRLPAEAEPEGIDVVDALGGVLHWVIRPASGQGNVLVHFAPTGRRAKLRLRVRPARILAGRRTVLRFRATRGGRPVTGAVIRLAGRWVRTGASGKARMKVRFSQPGRHRATATRADLRTGRAVIRVTHP
jgi:hypothetical protein